MQPIHRTSCQGPQPLSASCLADHLAALIDGQAQACRKPAGPPGGNALIWVEGEPGLADARDRGMMVVGHGPDPTATERSLVISYPVRTGDERQCLHAVSGALQNLGWSVVAFRSRKTSAGCTNTAVLMNHALPGGQQQLLLAEPIQAAQQCLATPMSKRRSYATRRAAPVRPGQLTGAGDHARKMGDQADATVNEGGAGEGATG